MEGNGKPLAAAGSYTINDLEDNFNPFETRSKLGNNPRGSFTISNDQPINDEIDENNLSHNKGEESSISHYEECIEDEQPLNHNNTNNNNVHGLGTSFDIEDEGFDKRVLNQEDEYTTDEIKPSSSYIINRKSSRDVDVPLSANVVNRSFNLDESTNDNYQEPPSTNKPFTASYDLEGSIENGMAERKEPNISYSIQDENMLFNSSVRLPEPPLPNMIPIHQEAQQLVNKSFTINKSNMNESYDMNNEAYRNADLDRIQQSEANNLNASYDIPNNLSTYRRPVANNGDQKKTALNSSYSIQEGSEDKMYLLQQNQKLNKQIKELTVCICEYEKYLELTLQNKIKSEGSSKVSMNVLLTERDQALEEAATIGRAYTDLQNRHEKSKELLKEYKKNEEKLHDSLKKMDEWSERQVAKYEKLRAMAEEKITRLNEDILQQRRNHQEEMEILQTRLKYQETKIRNLETDIKQKAEQNAELTEMCEILIKKSEQLQA